MSDEVQKSELHSDGNVETETFGDYIDKYRTLNQQIVSAKCQIQLLKDHDNRYQMQPWPLVMQWLGSLILRTEKLSPLLFMGIKPWQRLLKNIV